MLNVDIAIIGGGPAGLAAAVGAAKQGLSDIMVFEREAYLGGILNQCIHNGFGLHMFKEELTGPEYADRYIKKAEELNIPVLTDTTVLNITRDKLITAVNKEGLLEIQAKAVVLAMGCRERPRGALNIPGSRPVGIYTAGTAQKFVNIDGYLPGKEVVILGSGDIGLIMARRMTLEGAKVKAVVEILPYSGGLKRNIVQCLDDYGIPLKLSHTITKIHGRERLIGVTVASVDENKKPIPETDEYMTCDTLLLSVGLIPENELSKNASVELSEITGGPFVDESMQTSVDGIFACGNVLHVHDLVDFVSEESELAGENAVKYVLNKKIKEGGILIKAGNGVRYTVPVSVNPHNIDEKFDIRFRVSDVFTDKCISVYFDGQREQKRKKRIIAPGEMETITLKKEVIDKYLGAKKIEIIIED